MECKKVQDRLITEYVDKELGLEENTEVERHLTTCLDCREFFQVVQRNSLIPFGGTEEMQPDGAVWERIQERIEAERARSRGWFGGLVDALAPLLRMPQPVFRAAFVTALILVVVVLAKWPSSYADPVEGYIADQMTFMSGLEAGNADALNGDLKDYDSAFDEVVVE
ncbi:MAG: zf-HC2 domain-containing protein [Candidatus Omnitrophica bacterium]|nr:zf-HC2 domain-containing protein [Candidatus Omnitrophota bacterium]